MDNWNVVVTVHQQGLLRALELMSEFGEVREANFRSVLIAKIEDIPRFTESFAEWISRTPAILSFISRVLPVTGTFDFQSPSEFNEKVTQIATQWAPSLRDRTFHVRMHRRGLKENLKSQAEERFLDTTFLNLVSKAGGRSRLSFKNPDTVICLETVGPRAGLAMWTRDQIRRYPFLKLE